MRVIAGSARSMPIRTIKGMDARPTTDRTKETLFNILQTRIPSCRFLDLFAGTGAIGIEALSRGASAAFFVEKDRRMQALIEENLRFTKLIDRAKIIKGDVAAVLPTLAAEDAFDIIFMDPPFRKDLEKNTLLLLADLSLLADDGMIVVEADPRTDFSYLEDLPFQVVKQKRYSMSSHLFIQRR